MNDDTESGTRYGDLSRRVLRRDGWRCQDCGSRTNLEVHHLQFRSQGGEDAEENLITLCCRCHAQRHQGAKAASELE
jgi:5-methylcytosine-specific restriction endonuclease McrA